MKESNKLKNIESVSVITVEDAQSFKGGGGTGNGNGYPPPFGEENSCLSQLIKTILGLLGL
ncbi:MAG: hypothetical protein R3E32_08945 [Chitinophagales bacterium]